MVGDFRHFARPVLRIGSVETESNAQKPAVSGPFAYFAGTKTKRCADRLGWEDSNLELANRKKAAYCAPH